MKKNMMVLFDVKQNTVKMHVAAAHTPVQLKFSFDAIYFKNNNKLWPATKSTNISSTNTFSNFSL